MIPIVGDRDGDWNSFLGSCWLPVNNVDVWQAVGWYSNVMMYKWL